MKRFLSLFLILALLFTIIATSVGCSALQNKGEGESSGNSNTNNKQTLFDRATKLAQNVDKLPSKSEYFDTSYSNEDANALSTDSEYTQYSTGEYKSAHVELLSEGYYEQERDQVLFIKESVMRTVTQLNTWICSSSTNKYQEYYKMSYDINSDMCVIESVTNGINPNNYEYQVYGKIISSYDASGRVCVRGIRVHSYIEEFDSIEESKNNEHYTTIFNRVSASSIEYVENEYCRFAIKINQPSAFQEFDDVNKTIHITRPSFTYSLYDKNYHSQDNVISCVQLDEVTNNLTLEDESYITIWQYYKTQDYCHKIYQQIASTEARGSYYGAYVGNSSDELLFCLGEEYFNMLVNLEFIDGWDDFYYSDNYHYKLDIDGNIYEDKLGIIPLELARVGEIKNNAYVDIDFPALRIPASKYNEDFKDYKIEDLVAALDNYNLVPQYDLLGLYNRAKSIFTDTRFFGFEHISDISNIALFKGLFYKINIFDVQDGEDIKECIETIKNSTVVDKNDQVADQTYYDLFAPVISGEFALDLNNFIDLSKVNITMPTNIIAGSISDYNLVVSINDGFNRLEYKLNINSLDQGIVQIDYSSIMPNTNSIVQFYIENASSEIRVSNYFNINIQLDEAIIFKSNGIEYVLRVVEGSLEINSTIIPTND